jgi:uncharacterized protein YbjQ (UPF0145 family)
MAVLTGLSGNEIYCLQLKGLNPGALVIGNSVHSMGFLGGLSAGLTSIVGGEVREITEIISDGRHLSQARLLEEARRHNAYGITGVTSELRQMQGAVEFLSVASCVHGDSAGGGSRIPFSTSSNGQELFCLLDAGYLPKQFVMGNVAYSVGLAGGLFGAVKSMARGEIKEFSDILNATRHLALQRIVAEARAAHANAVIGIETRIMPFRGAHEMLMIGTAAHHPALNEAAPVTSDLTCEEMWNLAALGFMPLKLVLGTAVYSLGIAGSLKALFRSVTRGELGELTSLIYDAREHAIGLIEQEAAAIRADDVVGVKTYIHELGGLIEFMAIGTAVRRVAGAPPASAALPAQAIIRDKDTWISEDDILATSFKAGRG